MWLGDSDLPLYSSLALNHQPLGMGPELGEGRLGEAMATAAGEGDTDPDPTSPMASLYQSPEAQCKGTQGQGQLRWG